MNNPEIHCIKCGWEGKKEDRDGINCPDCGDHREIYDWGDWPESIAYDFNDFNWNQK
jgi:Zn finger protein HypA/HybF involved in hydrogenase expression